MERQAPMNLFTSVGTPRDNQGNRTSQAKKVYSVLLSPPLPNGLPGTNYTGAPPHPSKQGSRAGLSRDVPQQALDKGAPRVKSQVRLRGGVGGKRRRRVSSSSENSSDNEDAETGHWKSKNKYREDEDEDMSRPWRSPKSTHLRGLISDFSEDKKRRMPANVKTYDGDWGS
ncbi:hypothetical protein Tco_0752022 [Tanacetum coccineum]|uniref:Uncharacterized protein n=1 Tax=Tanacetum coccineum TaxID=301880 RepID=A0ABQ4Z7B6_9ASTR